MEDDQPAIKPRMINLVTPMLMVIFFSFFFFWYFGRSKDGGSGTIASVIAATDPNKAMLVTYFFGSGWAASALIMPFAITLAVSGGSVIPICVAAVITGGTFGDVTSPVAGMTNMASNAVGADQVKYLKYASPYNFAALALAAILFLMFGSIGGHRLK